MSVWWSASGTIVVSKNAHVSISKLLQEVAECVRVNKTYDFQDKFKYHVEFSSTGENITAAKQVDQILNKLLELDSSAIFDLDANIRFIN